mgnify:CR=1 FL=1
MKLSIIVPVYKVEEYLGECVDSLLSQTIDDYEIILVDDGSPDNSGKIADEYAAVNPDMIRVLHIDNGGQGRARNFALDIAKGLLDNGIHPPTMYFPLIVHEALMVEPTETESKATMDEAIEVFRALARLAHEDPEALHTAPHNTPVRRLDEVQAARNPVLRAALAE